MVNLVHVLSTVVDATSLSVHDKQKLTALVQAGSQDGDDAADMGAPSAEAYVSKSGSITDVLEDLREKAAGALSDARKEEMSAAHNYALLKQGLEDDIKNDSKDMAEAKAAGAAAAGTKATLKATWRRLVRPLPMPRRHLPP